MARVTSILAGVTGTCSLLQPRHAAALREALLPAEDTSTPGSAGDTTSIPVRSVEVRARTSSPI